VARIDVTLGIIGNGVVGGALTQAYLPFVKDVLVFDKDPGRSPHRMHQAVMDSDLVFVCLPTPSLDGGECDASELDWFFSHVGGMLRNRNYVIKSTVPVGYTKSVARRYGMQNVCHCPEFLTQRTAYEDAANPACHLIGVPFPNVNSDGSFTPLFSGNNNAAQLLNGLAHAIWTNPRVRFMSSDESEAAKLGLNAFYAIKVAAFNELRAFFDTRGCDWDAVLEGMLSQGTVNPSHTKVPGPDGRYGFGGSCLPKDLSSLVRQIEAQPGCRSLVAWAAMERNETVDRNRPVAPGVKEDDPEPDGGRG
jgi:UDP-glucose 6-dehydrogenase